jgi:hypothetical protein
MILFDKKFGYLKSRRIFEASQREIIITTKQKTNNMKTITTQKYNKVENTDKEFLSEGIVAFQVVKFTINFYGNEIETTHDTKIMQDGTQIVIGGCGYISAGFIVK